VPSPVLSFRSSMLRRPLHLAAVAPAGVLVCFYLPINPVDAARGGRIGGGSFVPLLPFPRRRRNFRGALGWRVDSAVAGSDSPFLIPMFGIRRRRPVRPFLNPDEIRRGCWSTPCAAVGQAAVGGALPSAMAQLCHASPDGAGGGGPVAGLACLANARELQQDLRRLAETANTSQQRPACRRCCRKPA